MYTYSQLELVSPPKVFGLKFMRPTIGHMDILCGMKNPLYRGASPGPYELAQALFVFSRPWKKAVEQINNGQAQRVLRRLNKRCWKMKEARLSAAVDSINEFIAIYSAAPPRWEEGGEKGQARAPWHLSVFGILQEKTNLTADEAWSLTVSRAFELCAVIGANAGDDKLVSVAEMEIYQKMMKADENAPSPIESATPEESVPGRPAPPDGQQPETED